MAGTLRGITTGMIPGIAIVPGGLILPGTVPVGDSVGAGVVSMPAGALLGTARRGAGRIVPVTGVADIGGITTIITIIRIITGRPDVQLPVVIPQDDQVLTGIGQAPTDLRLIGLPTVPHL